MDGFQKKFHVKLAIWTGDGQKLCEKSALTIASAKRTVQQLIESDLNAIILFEKEGEQRRD